MEDYEYEDDFEEEISGGSSRKLSPKRKPPPKANKTSKGGRLYDNVYCVGITCT